MRLHWPEIRATLALALPMILGQLGQMSLHLIDAAMIGRIGVVPLAAAAFGGNLIGFILIIGYGLVAPIPIFVARAFGGGDLEEGAHVLQHGLWIVLPYTLFWALVIHLGTPLLFWFGQPVEVVETARPYVIFLGWSIVPTLLYASFRSYTEAHNRPWLPLAVLATGFLLNILLNWIFIFGKLGSPPLGIAGAGLATLLARLFMLVFLASVLIRSSLFSVRLSVLSFVGVTGKKIKRMLSIGIPTAFQIAFETGMFTMAAIMIGWLGATPLAAHLIAVNVAAMSFMLPMGMSFAVTIRIGQALGRKDPVAIRRIGFSAIGFAVLAMSAVAVVYLIFRHRIPALFIADAGVIKLASQLLIVAALFQVFDGTQIISNGALRGLGDVRIPTFLGFCGYWLVGIPVGYILAFHAGLHSLGIWIGLLTGLGFAALALATRFYLATR